MHKVFERVCNWNAKRYDQEYNHELTLSLLREEYKEWCEAKSPVERLDAICDITYVAMGALWKLGQGLSFEKVQHAYLHFEGLLDAEVAEPLYLAAAFLDDAHYEEQDDDIWLYHILAVAGSQALCMGLTIEQYEAAMLVVCDSNDSKSVKKTASDVKANDGDKGVYFTPPEPRLQAILNQLKKEEKQCQLQLH